MIDEKDWIEFKDSGMLQFINTILHTFGWAIVIELDDNKDIIKVYPARVKFRGFSEKSNSNGYKKVSKYMQENADTLLKESEE